MGFNVNAVDPTYTGPKSAGTLLRKGAYRLEITHQEEKVTGAGDKKYVELTVSVLEPSDFEGQRFYQKIHTVNSVASVDISNRMLAGIGNAIGVLEGEWDALLHKSFTAEVTIEKNKNSDFPDSNQLGRIYWEDGSAPAKLGPSGPPSASTAAVQRPVVVASNPAPQAAAARPWATKR